MKAIQRLLAMIDRSGGPEACHLWLGARDNDGYGWFHTSQGARKPHRWLIGYRRGAPLDPGELVCHRCDNPPCCNPRHLYVGTSARNSQDMVERGRGRTNGNDRRTHCIHGHPFDARNTYLDPRGFRQCRTCAAHSRRRYRERRACS